MMKANNKNRKHPTCSRCRFHGKKDIRVLQHQCPFRNCTCSSCFLIKRRSIIYRAQKNLDKHEDNSNEAVSPSSSYDGSANSSNFSETINKNVSCSVSKSSDNSSDAINYGGQCLQSGTDPPISVPPQSWPALDEPPQHSCLASTSAKNVEHYRISDFQSLCLTFPELTPSQLQTIFEQCGNDFQRTIDRILITKWCNDSDSKANLQLPSTPISSSDYSDVISFSHTGLHASATLSDNSLYHTHNSDNCFDWRTSYACSNAYEDNYYNQECGVDYYYDQSLDESCGVISQQGNYESMSPNWNREYTPYWYTNNPQQGISNHTNHASYDVNNGSQDFNHINWQNCQIGELALTSQMHDNNA